jgi:mannose-6-phosphate isomerase
VTREESYRAEGAGATSERRTARAGQDREERPWGRYEVLDEGSGFKVKRIVVRPAHRFSYQRHERRDEYWVFVSGRGTATLDDDVVPVAPGTRLDVPCGAAHRVACTGTDDLVLIEVQVGSYLGEDDIIRLADDYDR